MCSSDRNKILLSYEEYKPTYVQGGAWINVFKVYNFTFETKISYLQNTLVNVRSIASYFRTPFWNSLVEGKIGHLSKSVVYWNNAKWIIAVVINWISSHCLFQQLPLFTISTWSKLNSAGFTSEALTVSSLTFPLLRPISFPEYPIPTLSHSK